MKFTVACNDPALDTPVELLVTDSFQEAVEACCDNCEVKDEDGDIVHVGRWEDWGELDEDKVEE